MSGKGIDNSASQVPGNDGRYVIVITRWNEEIVTGLLKGATQALAKAGIEGEQVEVVSTGCIRNPSGLSGRRPKIRLRRRGGAGSRYSWWYASL